MGLRIAIRVDASSRMGSGHVMRCLTLAQELRTRGATVSFVSRVHPGNLLQRCAAAGFEALSLPAPPPAPGKEENYAAWLGVTPEQDAAETLAALGGRRFDWLIVDHYGLSRSFEQSLRSCAARVLVIDDLANREHDCDLLLDQNYAGAQSDARYAGLVPAGCRQLLGPGVALLQGEYARLRALLPARDGSLRRVLVFFGGSDPTGSTLRVVEALAAPELRDIGVDVVLGRSDPNYATVQAAVNDRPGAALHSDLPGLAGLMARADLAVGAGGGSTWERACLGLPAVVALIAENQRPASERLAADGYQVLLGHGAELAAEDWRRAIIALRTEPARLRTLAARAASLVDGNGAARVADAMQETASVPAIATRPPPAGARSLEVTLLSDASSWLNPSIEAMARVWTNRGHQVRVVHSAAELPTGDVCFAIGCSQMLKSPSRARHTHTLVVHESALPEGRGWSPMTWQVLEDRRRIVVTLFEAVDNVDAGAIHLQTTVSLDGTELVDEWRALQAAATAELCTRWLDEYPAVLAGVRAQQGTPTSYARRGAADSRLDPAATLAQQFDLLRVVDNERYPAWFELRGRRYRIAIFAGDPVAATDLPRVSAVQVNK